MPVEFIAGKHVVMSPKQLGTCVLVDSTGYGQMVEEINNSRLEIAGLRKSLKLALEG